MTAIIPAAGRGTRFLPVTKAIPKEMLPIGAKPALELIVEEAKAAGASEIVMVISRDKELIREYFKGDSSISFVYQEKQLGLGHAVLTAEVNDEVLILLGDALIAGEAASVAMTELSRARGGCGVIGCERVPGEMVSRYGILSVEGERVVDLVEKPTRAAAPSDLAIAGRYLLPPAIFGFLKTQAPGKGGEIQLTDAIRRLLATHTVLAYRYRGKRQDIGNPQGYFEALRAMGANV